MSHSDSDELIVSLASLVRLQTHVTALVMRELDVERIDAEVIVATIRFGTTAAEGSWAYTEAMNQSKALGVDWQVLRAIVKEDDGASESQGDDES